MIQALPPRRGELSPGRSVVVERTPGELFYSPGRLPGTLYAILRGRVSVARSTRGGRRLVTEVLQTGEGFGDLSLCGVAADNEVAEAVTHCRALALGSRDVKVLVASNPELALRIMTAMARRLSAASDRLEELTCRPVEARVALALLRIAGSDGRTVSASHQVVADLAGTHRETTSRRLGNLQVKGLLRLGRCVIEITDRRALADLANG